LDPGFVTKNLLTFQAFLPGGGDEARITVLNRQLNERLRAVPGVATVAQVSLLPFATRQNVMEALEIQDRPVPPGQRPSIDVRYTTADYFLTMGIPISKGTVVTEHDTNLVTINEAAARRF